MNRSMLTAAVSMGQLQHKLDTIGNNLANSNTNGYKKRDVRFGELLAQQINNQPRAEAEIGRLTPQGIRIGTGAKATETAIRLTVGPMQTTNRNLDLALANGNQFFRIQSFDGEGNEQIRYTRDGAFYVTPVDDNQVALVTANGDYVLGVDGPITFNEHAKDITIQENGTILVTNEDNTQEAVGQLDIVEILRPQLLVNDGNNLFALPDLAELGIAEADVLFAVAPENRTVQQGMLESSNVDMGTELTEMLMTQRMYQFHARSIGIADQMLGLINGLR